MKRGFIRTAAIAAASAAAGTFAASFGIYMFGFYSPRGKQNDDHHILAPIRTREQYEHSIELIDRLNARPFERVCIRSFDGLRLSGRSYHTKDGAPLAILCHGYRGTPSRDFCGGADIFFGLGFNVLLIEERAHCSSGGHSITFGVKERFDVLSWTGYAVERFGPEVRILLAGISMGAGTVLMASELDLPGNVRGILADCPFTSPAEIIKEFGRANGIPMRLAYPFASLGARLFGGFSLTAAETADIMDTTLTRTISIADCESEIKLHLSFRTPDSVEIEKHAEDIFIWNGITYTEEGTYIQYFNNIHGCDSTVILTLTLDGNTDPDPGPGPGPNPDTTVTDEAEQILYHKGR